MDELLAVIANVEDEEDVVIRLRNAAWSDSSLSLRLEICLPGSQPEQWNVQCQQALTYELNGEGSYSLELVRDHPLLWEFKRDSGSAYFCRAPADSCAAVGALYEAHQKGLGTWIKFGQHLNHAAGLVKLLKAGNGLLARGPMPLLALYKAALHPYGVELDIRFDHPPRRWNGSEWQQCENDINALLLGTSYVVGRGWSAARIAEPQ